MPAGWARQANIKCPGAGPPGETGDLFRWGDAALFSWAGAEPVSGQGGFKHEETGWPDNAYCRPTSADFVLIEATRPARNRPQHGTAPAQTGHRNHGATLAART